MRRLIATLLAVVLTVALVLVSSPADAATDRTNVSFTSAAGITSKYHVYEPAAPTERPISDAEHDAQRAAGRDPIAVELPDRDQAAPASSPRRPLATPTPPPSEVRPL